MFYGTADRTSLQPPPSASDWEEGSENVAGWLSWLATHFLTPDSYNAAKHGFTVRAGNSELSLRVEDLEIAWANGAHLSYLKRDKHNGRERWQLVTQWMPIDMTLYYIYSCCRLSDALWQRARERYVGAAPQPIALHQRPSIADVRAADKLSFATMAETLK